jgi:hypothetical protein
MILLTEHFPAQTARMTEYETCLNENIKNPLIETIVLFIDELGFKPKDSFLQSPKVKIERGSSRANYRDFLTYASSNYPDQICCIANADIIIGSDVGKISKEYLKGKFLALTRWDLKKQADGTFQSVFFENPRSIAQASQDTWIFLSPIVIKDSQFTLGKPGCDNKIAHLAKESGLVVTNPSLLIKTYHLHETGIRSYSGRDLVPGPWQVVPPTDSLEKLSDLNRPWAF